MSPSKSAEPKIDARIDAYIAKSRPFAQPILWHLRELVHKACPGVEETMKWSRPFFQHNGTILGHMSAFNQHCSFGFWGQEMEQVLRDANLLQEDAMGSLGRIGSVQNLPPAKQMVGLIRQAVAFIDRGQQLSPIAARGRKAKAPAPEVEVPAAFTQALKANKKAAAEFAAFSPGSKREYLEWIVEARREETRAKRIATAIEWIGEGKQRNWKYQNC